MEKQELAMILDTIDGLYPNYLNMKDEEVAVKTARAWYMVLQKYDYDKVMDELEKYAENSVYPPKMHDLVKNLKDSNYNIPNLEETREIIKTYTVENPVDKEVMKADIAKLRKQLKKRG